MSETEMLHGTSSPAGAMALRTTATLIAGVVAIGAEALVVSPLLDDISASFGRGVAHAGLAVTAYGLAFALTAPFAGVISDRFSRRGVMAGGLLLFALSGLCCAAAETLGWLLAARAFCGIAAGAFLPACYAYVGDEVAFDQRAKIMGRVMLGWAIAMVGGVPLGGALGAWIGWRDTFLALAGLGLVAALGVWRLPSHQHRARASATAPLAATFASLRAAFAAPGVKRLLLVDLLDMISFYGVYTYLGAFLRARFGFDSSGAGLMAAAYGLGIAIISLNAGWLDRIGKPRAMIYGFGALSLVLAALPSLAFAAPALALGLVMWGIAQGCGYTSLVTLATLPAPERRGGIMALLSCATYLGVTIGSGAMGVIYTRFGFQTVAFLCAGSVALATWIARGARHSG